MNKGRVYLIVIAVAMMAAAGVVLALNRDLATELLGGIAFLGGAAVLINVILDLTDDDKREKDDR